MFLGSRRQVDDLEEEIVVVNCGKSMGEKQFEYISPFTAIFEVFKLGNKSMPVEGMRWKILSLLNVILSLKKLIK